MKPSPRLTTFAVLAFAALAGCYYDVETELYPGADCIAITPGYTSHVETLIAEQCAGCHAGSAPSGGLSLEYYGQIRDAALSGAIEDRISLSAGDPLLMPPNGPLNACDIEAFVTWVADGAPEN